MDPSKSVGNQGAKDSALVMCTCIKIAEERLLELGRT